MRLTRSLLLACAVSVLIACESSSSSSLPEHLPHAEAGSATEGAALGRKLDEKTGINLALIPAGSFQMGSTARELGRGLAEGPQHSVHISQAFWMAEHEVTNAQYQRFLTATSHPSPQIQDDDAFNGPDQPVVGVSWADAYAYCRWAGMQLPTEAQWEYAARSGSTGRYWSGDSAAALAKIGWYADNSGNATMPVAQKPASPWGLYDMHGNVWNWTADWYGDYSSNSVTDPKGPDEGSHRVFRGGSWVDPALGARSATRMWHQPEASGRVLGFRPVVAALSVTTRRGPLSARAVSDEVLSTDDDVQRRAWVGGYVDGEKDGAWTTWHGNGQKAWEGYFAVGELTKSTTWYESGQKAGMSDYARGGQPGKFWTWHKNGRMAGEGTYAGGAIDARTCWNEAGEEEPCPY